MNRPTYVQMPVDTAQTLIANFQFNSPLVQKLSVEQLNAVRQLLQTIEFPKSEPTEEPTAVDGTPKETK